MLIKSKHLHTHEINLMENSVLAESFLPQSPVPVAQPFGALPFSIKRHHFPLTNLHVCL